MADAGTLTTDTSPAPAIPPTAPGHTLLERPALAPVAPDERIASIDVLRGFALLGILPMNILTGFALSHAAFLNPPIDGGFDAANRAVWLGTHLVFDMKMMSIFSMLFGAGLIVMSDRANARGASLMGTYYRRLAWLALIGLLHAYLLWYGDILFSYAICGMLLYPIRRLPAWGLMLIAAAMIPVAMLISYASGLYFDYARDNQPEIWAGIAAGFTPDQAQLDAEAAARSGSYLDLLKWNFPVTLSMHVMMLPIWGVWRVTGLMILGMALMKTGVFSAARSTRFYLILAAAGYGIGLPLVWVGAMRMEAAAFDPVYIFKAGWHYNYYGSIAVALGHIGLFMLACRSGCLGALGRGLAAVGRTALSNYLFQTVVCLALFTGLGLFGRLDRVQLLGITVAIWIVQVALSTAWLRAGFIYGPAEWAWRSLTYWRPQPMRRTAG